MVECFCNRVTQHKPVAQIVGMHWNSKLIRMLIYLTKNVVICPEILSNSLPQILFQSYCILLSVILYKQFTVGVQTYAFLVSLGSRGFRPRYQILQFGKLNTWEVL